MPHNIFPEPADAPCPGVYRHYKGSLYQVMGMARHSETEEWLVVYQALYGDRGFWLRPLPLWLKPVVGDSDRSTGLQREAVQRFRLIEANSRSLQSVIEPG